MSPADPYPYCVTVTPPSGPAFYLGFPTAREAGLIRERLERMYLPARYAGTVLDHGPTPPGVTPLPPVPADEHALANELSLQRTLTHARVEPWPGLFERLAAQKGQATAGPLMDKAKGILNRMHPQPMTDVVPLARVVAVLRVFVTDEVVVDAILDALSKPE